MAPVVSVCFLSVSLSLSRLTRVWSECCLDGGSSRSERRDEKQTARWWRIPAVTLGSTHTPSTQRTHTHACAVIDPEKHPKLVADCAFSFCFPLSFLLCGCLLSGCSAPGSASFRLLHGVRRWKVSRETLQQHAHENKEREKHAGTSLIAGFVAFCFRFPLSSLLRGNEQVGLALIQSIWLREHNFQARKIFASDHSLSNDEVFLRARRIVIAEIQKVLLDWFSALGIHIPDYPGYTGRDPQSTLEFVSGAMRVGHTQISNDILAVGANMRPACGGGVTLANSFFNPQVLFPAGCPEAYIRGLAHSPCEAVDVYQVSNKTRREE